MGGEASERRNWLFCNIFRLIAGAENRSSKLANGEEMLQFSGGV